MPLSRRRVTDAASLKALAHPVRLALIELLVTDGPKTASQAAAVLGETPANCSWHLRKLAEHGFVREVTGTPGRSRPWRAVTEGLSWEDDSDNPEASAAADALMDMLLERELQRLRAARAAAPSEPEEWRHTVGVNQSQAWMTPEEAKELCDAMVELFLRHSDRITDPDRRPPGARLISLVGWVAPSGPVPKER